MAVNNGVVTGQADASGSVPAVPAVPVVPANPSSVPLLHPAYNTPAAAPFNSAAIQAALDLGGHVVINAVGDVYINSTLIIGSDTTLELGQQATLRLVGAGNAGFNMLKNKAFLATPDPVTVAWTSGYKTTVTQNSHPYVVGDYVWLRGSLPSAFVGIFHVIERPNANTLVVNLVRLPTSAPTGNWVCSRADENIKVIGGIWNYDALTNYIAGGMLSHCILLSGIFNLRVRDVRVNNAIKYCFATGALSNARFDNIGTDFNYADCLKMYGPIFNTHVDGLTGNTGDDSVTFQSKEGNAYAQFAWTSGDILNCTVSNVNTYSRHNICGCFPSDDEYIDQIVFNNIRGNGTDSGIHIGAQATAGSGLSQGNIGSITLNNFCANGDFNTQILVGAQANIKELIINEMIALHDGAASTVVLTNNATSTIDAVTFNNLLVDVKAPLADSITIINNNGIINAIKFNGGNLTRNGTQVVNAVASNPASTLKLCSFNGTVFNNNVLPVQLLSGVLGIPKITLDGCLIESDSQGVLRTDSSAQLTLTNNSLKGITWGALFVTAGSPVITFTESGNKFTGTWITVSGGTPVISVFGEAMRVPLNSTWLTRTANSYCIASANVGTIVGGNAVMCDTTNAAGSWKQLTNTANNY